jgi:hypothetical protein
MSNTGKECGVIEADECVHHFLIEAPEGRTSLGVCKKCGLEREHINSMEVKLSWEALHHKGESWLRYPGTYGRDTG